MQQARSEGQQGQQGQRGQREGQRGQREGQQGEVSIEQVLKAKYAVYVEHKHLIEELCALEEAEVLEPYAYLWGLGGKKVRVIAALLVHDLFEQKFREEAVRVGGLIEHLHCASLIIDDIEDGSVQRRGQPCAHAVFGVDSAINAANLMYFLPIHKLLASVTCPQLKWRINEIYLKEMTTCHVGQGLDIKYHKAASAQQLPSAEEYIKLTSLKTGGLLRMLVRMMGAVMGLEAAPVQQLADCMSNVGIAFQIIDDVLNVANSEESMGKGVVAEDLHERKFTLIVDRLRNNARFLELFFQPVKPPAVILELLQIINESGVLVECRAKAKEYADAALECLRRLECPGDKKQFELFIRYIIERKN